MRVSARLPKRVGQHAEREIIGDENTRFRIGRRTLPAYNGSVPSPRIARYRS